MPPDTPPARIVHALAPIRVCDNGGWTDTWFAGHGRVFNIAVHPSVEVDVTVRDRSVDRPQVVLNAENYGERYAIDMAEPLPDRHPLLEETIAEVGVPDDVAVDIDIWSDAPAGCSTGTSAAVTVALVGALDALTPGRRTAHEVAATAHRVESERLGLQSGVQDQLCSAYGGVSFIEMHDFPHATVSPVRVDDRIWWELERRLVLVFLGRTHTSSAVHEKVIAELEGEGPSSPRLEVIRRCADAARDAFAAGDFDALGVSMRANTDAQAALHPDLVSPEAQRVIDVASAAGATGWKVNGAGGEGGSITLLAGRSASATRALRRAVEDADPLFQVIPTHLSRTGLRVWDG